MFDIGPVIVCISLDEVETMLRRARGGSPRSTPRPPDHPKIASEDGRRRPAELARPGRRQGTRLE